MVATAARRSSSIDAFVGEGPPIRQSPVSADRTLAHRHAIALLEDPTLTNTVSETYFNMKRACRDLS